MFPSSLNRLQVFFNACNTTVENKKGKKQCLLATKQKYTKE
jgi:hypothetical protein